MISWIPILFIGFFAAFESYASEDYDPSYFKKEYLSYDRSHNLITRKGIPVQLEAPLEAELRSHKSKIIKAYMEDRYSKGQRHVDDHVMDAFVSSTVVDWLYENLKEAEDVSNEESNYKRVVEMASINAEFDTTPFLLISDKKTYQIKYVELITLRKRDNTFITRIPRAKHPELQLTYCEGGKLTSYTDVYMENGLRLMVPSCSFPKLPGRVQHSVSIDEDIIMLGDWVITSAGILPRYEYDSTPLPDAILAQYVPKPLKEKVLRGLFETLKAQMRPILHLGAVIRSLWNQEYPSTPKPKTLDEMQAADADRRLLQKIFSHPTLTHNIGFKGTSKRLEELAWTDLYTKCRNIDDLILACKISSITEVTNWQDIFDIGASINTPAAPAEVIKILLASIAVVE